MPSVLFVCTANICRSPLAEGLMKCRIAGQPDADQWRIESAGTWGLDGEKAVDEVLFLLKEKGIDLSNHRARTVTRQIIEPFNLVLTMEERHRDALRAEFPFMAKRIFLLSEMIGALFDIHDPIGKPLKEYRRVEELIDRVLEEGAVRIRELASRSPTIPISR